MYFCISLVFHRKNYGDMKITNLKMAILGFLTLVGMNNVSAEEVIFSNEAYTWRGDTIFQGEFFATAPSGEEIVSTYSAAPGYFMPVDKRWVRKNDLTAYPRLKGGNKLLEAVYTMGLDEMVNNVEPDTTLRTGKEWAGVWTRDVSYSIILSMAAMQPEASKVSLMRKVNSDGQIIQDTGSGGAWPISTDRMIWIVAAYELYKVTGDKEWLKYMYEVGKNSLEKDIATVMSPDGLFRGETSFIDWREQSYPKWMQTADIYNSEAFNTNVVHYLAMDVMADAARRLGNKADDVMWQRRSSDLYKKIIDTFWMDDKGYFAMYRYGRDFPILNPRSETLGQALFSMHDGYHATRITQNAPVTKWGAPIFYPQIADMPSYHNNALWPFVAAYWTLANANAGNEDGVLHGIASIVRPAALFATNKENLTLDNGDITTELNSSNMLWSLSGNIALVQRLLFGIKYTEDGIYFDPFIPKALADTRTLSGLRYRDAILNITVEGYGNRIAEFYINGREDDNDFFLPADAKGVQNIRIVMADNTPLLKKVNVVDNKKAPLTPIARWAYTPEAPFTVLEWNPIEYIASYDIIRDGKVIDNVRTTTYDASVPGEYMVVGVEADGTRGFASEPLSNRPVTIVDMPGEVLQMRSAEVAYEPQSPVKGMQGGFVELDQTAGPLEFTYMAPEEGEYMIAFRYANGNGPVNTENKAAIRSLAVNGEDNIYTIVMPQRGIANWNDWGMTNHVRVKLQKGENKFRIFMRPQDRNMNLRTNHALIDNAVIYKL